MVGQKVHVLDDFKEVESITDRWNDLWCRSDASAPTSRVELLGNWLEQFAPKQRFQAIVVEQDDRLVAALPLVASRLGKLIPACGLPQNHWSGGGELLVDPSQNASTSLRLIAKTLGQQSWPLYRFSHVRGESPIWQRFIDALREAGLDVECRPSHEVKFIEIPANWESYRQQFSKSHRQRLTKMFKRLRQLGEVNLRRHVPETRAEAHPLLDRAFEIEDSGWKGREGTSLLRAPGMADHVKRMSDLMLPRRELEVAFVELNGAPISFQILWNSKGVLHAYKGGYDERFQRFGVGHLTIHELLHELCQTQRCRAYDCLGPNTPAIDQWIGSTYRTSQVTVAPRQWLGRAMLFTYRRCRPFVPATPIVETPDELSCATE